MTNNIADEFLPAEESIGWAEGATAELNALITSFFKGDVAEIVVEIDSDTGENVQKIKFKAHIPKDFRRKATEALNNARHSFDQSIFAARNIVAKRSAKGLNYPWSRSPTDLDRLLCERGIDSRLWDVIRDHQPYPTSDGHAGGDDVIRTLATIANNKHTVGLSVQGHIARTKTPGMTGTNIHSLSINMPMWDSQKNEAELMRWIGDVEVEGDYEFNFVICLKDSRLSMPIDVVLALHYFTQKAKVVCETLKAKCFELSQ